MSGALVFIGFMGAGKSSAVRAAGEAGMEAVDADELLEQELGMPIAEFFADKGEAAFRQREAVFHSRLLERGDGAAIALGGGSVVTRAVREALEGHTVVWLDVSADTAWSRVGGQPGRPGSEAHDEIFHSPERGYFRETNRAGGLEGGMTTGQPLVLTAAMKPLPTLTKPLRSVDIATKEPAQALRERTDSTTVPAAGVVGEAMVAFVLADAYRRKFGGDHIDDAVAALRAYEERIGWVR